MKKEYHLGRQDIPDGHSIFEERVHVAGLQFYRGAATSFCCGSEQNISLRPNPENISDKNAISVIGDWRGWFFQKSKQIGFIPKEIAERLAANNLTNCVRGRLLKTYVGDGGFVEIIIQITGPSESKTKYRAYSGDMSAKIKLMEEDGDTDAIISMLLEKINNNEGESKRTGSGVAPRTYEQLAMIYRKLKRYDDELAVMERWNDQIKSHGAMRPKMEARLIKARERAQRKRK